MPVRHQTISRFLPTNQVDCNWQSGWSTPIVAGDRIFCVNAEGQAKVVQLGEVGTIVGTNDFGEAIKGSPAMADGALYVRSDQYLWKIAAE